LQQNRWLELEKMAETPEFAYYEKLVLKHRRPVNTLGFAAQPNLIYLKLFISDLEVLCGFGSRIEMFRTRNLTVLYGRLQ
jgi:hypothetical protein